MRIAAYAAGFSDSQFCVKENQRISTRTDLEVLNSVDLIITTSIMQSGDESDCECVKRYGRGAVSPTRLTRAEDDRD